MEISTTSDKKFKIILSVLTGIIFVLLIIIFALINRLKILEDKQSLNQVSNKYQIQESANYPSPSITQNSQISSYIQSGPFSDYGKVSEWKNYHSYAAPITFKYPPDCKITADNHDRLIMACPSHFLNIFVKKFTPGDNKTEKCENMSLKSGEIVETCSYKSANAQAGTFSYGMFTVFNIGTKKEMYFDIRLSPEKYTKEAWLFMKNFLSTFEITNEISFESENGLITYEGPSTIGSKPFIFKFPDNYSFYYGAGRYFLDRKNVDPDKNNQSGLNSIIIDIDTADNQIGIEAAMNKFYNNYKYTEVIENGIYLSGVADWCPQDRKLECNYVGKIIIKYGENSAIFSVYNENYKAEALAIAKSFKVIE